MVSIDCDRVGDACKNFQMFLGTTQARFTITDQNWHSDSSRRWEICCVHVLMVLVMVIHSLFMCCTFCLVSVVLEPDLDLSWWQSDQWSEMFTFWCWQISLLTEPSFQLKSLRFREQNSSFSFLAGCTISWPVILSRLPRSVHCMFIVVIHFHFFSIVLNVDVMVNVFCVWWIWLRFWLLVTFDLISSRHFEVMLLTLMVVQLLLKVLEIFAIFL